MDYKYNIHTTGVIVAHPDDETLWAGGTILLHPEWCWKVYALCRASDSDRAPKFRRALSALGAKGRMADLDDGPEQYPLSDIEVQGKVFELVGRCNFDRVITHAPYGEYTRHRRHEETSKAVRSLWIQEDLRANSLWLFAYDDGNGEYLPRAIAGASRHTQLPTTVWQKKYRIITNVYGFKSESWEARTTPRSEAFWCFESPSDLKVWLDQKGITS